MRVERLGMSLAQPRVTCTSLMTLSSPLAHRLLPPAHTHTHTHTPTHTHTTPTHTHTHIHTHTATHTHTHTLTHTQATIAAMGEIMVYQTSYFPKKHKKHL